MSTAPAPVDLVQLADGVHRTYARVTARTARDVTVALSGHALVFDRATGRRRSPRVHAPPYRLATVELTRAAASPAEEG